MLSGRDAKATGQLGAIGYPTHFPTHFQVGDSTHPRVEMTSPAWARHLRNVAGDDAHWPQMTRFFHQRIPPSPDVYSRTLAPSNIRICRRRPGFLSARYSVVGALLRAGDEEPSREAVILVELGVPANLELVAGVRGREQQALARPARWWAVNGRHWPGTGRQQWHRVRPGTIERSTEDGELATAHLQRVTVLVFSVWVAESAGQQVRIIWARGLHDCQQAVRRLKDFDPAIVANDPISANQDCSPGADGDTGVLRAEADDLVELVVAKALPCITKGGIDSEKRFPVGPESANVYPRAVHWFSITAAAAARGPKTSAGATASVAPERSLWYRAAAGLTGGRVLRMSAA